MSDAPGIDARLTRLSAEHFEAGASVPPILDVTGAHPDAVARIGALPVITIRRVPTSLPPRVSDFADLDVPTAMASSLIAAVTRNPIASLVLTQLVRATATLSVASALTAESIAYSALQGGHEYAAWLSSRPESTGPADARPRVIVRGIDPITITLDRPDRANALDSQSRHELVAVLTALEHSDARITWRGSGAHFCAGGDLDEFAAHDDITRTHLLRLRQGLPGTLARLGHRVETHVQGAVIGAGLELSAFTARVVARSDARFRLPEVRMGLLPGSGGTVSVPRRIGPNRALILMLTGRVLSATQARDWGLVDEIVT